MFDYGDAQDSTGGTRLGVSEARVEAIDGDVCLVCGDTGAIKRRLGCRVVSVRDYGDDQNDDYGHERSLQLKVTTSPRAATTNRGSKVVVPLPVVLPPTVMTNSSAAARQALART